MITKVNISKIKPNPYQPDSRLEIPDDVAEKFGKSILEHGLLQTPVARQVCPASREVYEMGDGWLRLSGFRWLVKQGHKEFEEMPLDVRDLSDRQMADLVLEANSIRQDLNPIEKAKLFKKYLEDFKTTQAELARAHNISQGELNNTLRLLELNPDIQQKIISQEISETHGRTLLQLRDEKKISKVVEKVISRKMTVAELDADIKNTLWNDSMPLTMGQNSYETQPVFGLAGCQNCDRRITLKDRYSTQNRLRCNDKKCWHEKQNTALTEQNKAALAKLEKQGITRFVEYDWRTMTYLDRDGELRAECKKCDKFAAVKSEYESKKYRTVCTDSPCYDRIVKEVRAAQEAERLAEKEKAEQEIDRIFENMVRPGMHIPLGIIDCILRSQQYRYGTDELTEKLTRLFNPASQKDQKATNKSVLAFCRELDEDELMYHVLPRLAFEIFRTSVNDSAQVKQVLVGFQTVPEPKNLKEVYRNIKAASPLGTPEQDALFHFKRAGNDWIAVDNQGTVIAIANTKNEANGMAILSLGAVTTILNPKAEEFVLNHTYRISFKTQPAYPGDVTAQDVNTAITALGRSPEDVTQVKVYKSSGKVGESGGVGCGWSKCTETIKPSKSNPEPKVISDQKQSGAKIDSDPLAGLEIHTATREGGYHTFQLGKLNVGDTILKGCVLLLGQHMKWGATPDIILSTLKTFPASYKRDLLISILEGKELVEVK